MQNTGKCPKCGSEELLFVPSEPAFENDPYIRSGGADRWMRVDGISVNRYVCLDCGHVEQWTNPEELNRRPSVKAYWRQKAQEQKE